MIGYIILHIQTSDIKKYVFKKVDSSVYASVIIRPFVFVF